MSAAENMVVRERRNGDRRSTHLHVATPNERRGETLNRDERARTETLLVEAQAAADELLDRLAHLTAALQTACNEARHARAAGVASRRAAHLAAGAVSGGAGP